MPQSTLTQAIIIQVSERQFDVGIGVFIHIPATLSKADYMSWVGQGSNSVDIARTSPNLSLIKFGVMRHEL